MAIQPCPRPRPAEGPGLAGIQKYVCKYLATDIFQKWALDGQVVKNDGRVAKY